MLRINQIKLAPNHSEQTLHKKICKALAIRPEELISYTIYKQSIDARKKPDIFFSYTIDVQVKQESRVLSRLKNKVQTVSPKSYQLPSCGQEKLCHRPVVVGSGPAGIFCAYLLAKAGYRPILLERGNCVEQRKKDVEAFWETGVLNLSSNVQFGEGGAGTFSDGKLNTLVKDERGRNRFVLETFCEHGAPPTILYEQKPHIGTDILIDVVRNMRDQILQMGGEVRFQSQVTDLILQTDKSTGNRQLLGIVINGEKEFAAEQLILAIGHSARDTFYMLHEKQIPLTAKSFAVGVRIEHGQAMINNCQYGAGAMEELPAASYKLTAQLANGRSAYTFCMCPGGYVVNASSEEKRLAVNGMSYHDRDGENANSAVIVTVTPDDYGSTHPLSGITFQRELEEKAWITGQGSIPVQTFADFCKNKTTVTLGSIQPQCKGGYQLANVRNIFPKEIGQSLEEGIKAMDGKISGFGMEDAILSGVESRTSSPVKIERDSRFESPVKGIYPCGEGAGYAGGITSAAMDGMKVAESLIQRFSPSISSEFTKN